MNVYSTKFRFIPRREATGRLLQALSSHPLVVAVAPMGYGKTTVAREVAKNGGGCLSVFFSVPPEPRSAEGLWDSLWKEAGKQGLTRAGALRNMGFPKSPPQTRQALEILAAAGPALFIIDDYHHCHEQAVDVFLKTAVGAADGDFRFLLLSRTRPNLDLEELRASGRAAVFEQDLLAFSEREAKEYFFFNGVRDESVAENAWKYSEGWAAALWLCLRNSQAGKNAPPSGDIDSLLERLVFRPCPPGDRTFLVRLSLLDSFTAAEAAIVAGDKNAGTRLARIWDRIAFISRDETGGVYQFHGIFKDFLRKKLEARTGADLPALYRATAECHAARREYMTAYRLLAKAGQERDKARILELLQEQLTEMTPDLRWDEIRGLVRTIPWRLRLKQPYGFLSYLWLYSTLSEEGFDGALLGEFEKRVKASRAVSAPRKKRLAGEIEYLRAFRAFNDFALAHAHYANAFRLLNGPTFLDNPCLSWCCNSPHFIFIALRDAGGGRALTELVEKNAGMFSALMSGMSAGAHLTVRAEYHLERGEPDEAEEPLTDAMEMAELHENPTLLLMTAFSRARLLLTRGRQHEALSQFLDSTEKVRECGMFEHIATRDAALGYLAACVGRIDLAPRWLRDGSVYGPPYDAPHPRSIAMTAYGKILLARGDYAGLGKMLEKTSESLGPFDCVLGRIHKKIFEAILVRRGRGIDAATVPLRSAVELSRPDGFILPFVEYGDALLPLFRRLRRTAPDDSHLAKIFDNCNRSSHFSRESRSYKKSLLTAWERKIMRLVVKGRTTPSIAQSLGISESGVKTALRIAYGKLGARNRVEASRRFDAVYGTEKWGTEKWGAEKRAERLPVAADDSMSIKPLVSESGGVSRVRCRTAAGEALFKTFRSLVQTGGDAERMRALDLLLEPGAGEMAVSCMTEIRDAVQSFSWKVRANRPLGYLAFVRLFCWAGGETGLAGLWVEELEARMSESGASRLSRRVKGEAALVNGVLAFNDLRAMRKNYDEALALLKGPSRIHPQLLGWNFGGPHLSFSCLRGGDSFGELVKEAESAEQTLTALSGGHAKGSAAVMRMEYHLERGEFEAARACLDAFDRDGGGGLTVETAARFVQARLLLAGGGADKAVGTLSALCRKTRELKPFRLAESADLALGYICSGMGRSDPVPEWIRGDGRFLPRPGVFGKSPLHLVVQGRALLAAGEFDRLGIAARNMPLRFGVCDSLLGRIHARVLEAFHLQRRKGRRAALEALGDAVDLSRPDGLLLPVAEYGGLVTPLLRELKKEDRDDPHLKNIFVLADFIRRNNAGNGGKAGPAGKGALTLREQEIMRLMTRGLSNAAIGRELDIAADSVKKALTAAYAKLGASNRIQASRLFRDV